jgi:hypothetical protein
MRQQARAGRANASARWRPGRSYKGHGGGVCLKSALDIPLLVQLAEAPVDADRMVRKETDALVQLTLDALIDMLGRVLRDPVVCPRKNVS